MESKLEELRREEMEKLNKEIKKFSKKAVFYSRLVWAIILPFSITMFMMIFGLTGVVNNFWVSLAGCVGSALSVSTFVSAFLLGARALEKERKLKKTITIIEEQNKLTKELTFEYSKPLSNELSTGSQTSKEVLNSNDHQI